jgi:hypothetical protein
MVVLTSNHTLGRQRQEDCKFKVSLGYREKPVTKKPQTNKTKTKKTIPVQKRKQANKKPPMSSKQKHLHSDSS